MRNLQKNYKKFICSSKSCLKRLFYVHSMRFPLFDSSCLLLTVLGLLKGIISCSKSVNRRFSQKQSWHFRQIGLNRLLHRGNARVSWWEQLISVTFWTNLSLLFYQLANFFYLINGKWVKMSWVVPHVFVAGIWQCNFLQLCLNSFYRSLKPLTTFWTVTSKEHSKEFVVEYYSTKKSLKLNCQKFVRKSENLDVGFDNPINHVWITGITYNGNNKNHEDFWEKRWYFNGCFKRSSNKVL